ncbi:hypothetical protein CROQUDRAFT_95403 [Cronartium quercuum f. sp. fusiforme G11]|uniref:Uncharacterized protein n=1 Tax=Cronartium quercuum f. sp. fusiforme G11 TaxID=708437 RepID=A0A9P6NCC4_9BASI|nr:hypothetical protein CROQUDRAFT_95403 [Cronartium quercuum f. sp. fusiforme G11]
MKWEFWKRKLERDEKEDEDGDEIGCIENVDEHARCGGSSFGLGSSLTIPARMNHQKMLIRRTTHNMSLPYGQYVLILLTYIPNGSFGATAFEISH